MAAGKSHSSTPVRDFEANNLSFSVDSLNIGDSTRSLLSPLYESDRDSPKEQDFHSQEEELSEGEIVDKSTSGQSFSDCDRLETATVKIAGQKSPVDRSRSSQSIKSKNSSFSTSHSSSSSSASPSSVSTPKSKTSQRLDDSGFQGQNNLNPWEEWLLAKVIKDHKSGKINARKKQLQKERIEKELAEKTEKEKMAQVKRMEWLQLKNREEKLKFKLKKREEYAKACRKQEEEQKMKEKAEESYKKWYEMKQHERKNKLKSERKEEHVKKENEYKRKQKSNEAYKTWLEKAKRHQKATNNHFGYLSGKFTGYYDWTCYPMPAYNNPNPWVSPKIKIRHQGKLELQRPSPPLLFQELEERERKVKLKNSKLKKAHKGIH